MRICSCELTEADQGFQGMDPISVVLSGLGCAAAVDVQTSGAVCCVFTVEFRALSGPSPALETRCNRSQESVDDRFGKGKEFLV